MARLTTAQLAALAQAASNSRGRFRTGDPAAGGTVAAATGRALSKLGLFDHEATSGWRPQAIGVWHQYRTTARGRALIAVGRMLAPLFAGPSMFERHRAANNDDIIRHERDGRTSDIQPEDFSRG